MHCSRHRRGTRRSTIAAAALFYAAASLPRQSNAAVMTRCRLPNNTEDALYMSASQILGLQRLEVVKRLLAGVVVEVMPHSVAERTAEDERRP